MEEAVALAVAKLTEAEAAGMAVSGRMAINLATDRPKIYLGRVEEALAVAGEASEMAGSPETPLDVASRALYLALLGHRQEALNLLRRVMAETRVLEGEDETASVLTVLLETALNLEDRESAALLAERLAPVAAVATGTAYLLPICVARHLGAAASLLGDRAAARRYYEQALELAARNA